MRKVVHHLRNQPHAVRTRVAVMTAAIITGLIGLVFITTLPLRFAKVEGSADNTAAVINATGDTAGEQLNNMQESWAAISAGLQVVQDSSPGAQNQTTVPNQDAPQDEAFPQDGASTMDNNYY